MAVHINGIFDESTAQKIKESNILVVGAGGIGCELLKGLVLTGFEKITVVCETKVFNYELLSRLLT